MQPLLKQPNSLAPLRLIKHGGEGVDPEQIGSAADPIDLPEIPDRATWEGIGKNWTQ